MPLGNAVLTIGRLPDCNIVLADPNVSRHHAEIRPTATGYQVVDLDSTNGTKVNGARVSDHLLDDRDEITFGNTLIRFEAS
ncbi:MAG: FHA domain-containing protein [Acidimicrobiia bacterium]|nr:FHA domain-containing protein [Acidimicrobiia bacterium]